MKNLPAAGCIQENMSLELLEGVAKIRYALFVVADLLQQQVNDVGERSQTSNRHILHGVSASGLLDVARSVCVL